MINVVNIPRLVTAMLDQNKNLITFAITLKIDCAYFNLRFNEYIFYCTKRLFYRVQC